MLDTKKYFLFLFVNICGHFDFVYKIVGEGLEEGVKRMDFYVERTFYRMVW